jgi:hypothetical protein
MSPIECNGHSRHAQFHARSLCELLKMSEQPIGDDTMSINSEQCDAEEAAWLAWLLTSAYKGPAIREEFSRQLSARLDDALVAPCRGTQNSRAEHGLSS